MQRLRKLEVALIGLAVAVAGCASDATTDATTSSVTSAPGSTSATSATSATSVTSDVECAPREQTVAYRSIAGVATDLLSDDIFRPDDGCTPRPVLFWVHGGGWQRGDKANQLALKRSLAERNGWVLVSVNYRLTAPGNDVMWPDPGDDVATAIAFTLDHAAQFGIDPTHVAVMGHSAGGQLAAIVATNSRLMQQVGHDRADIDCLVSLDTEGYDLAAKSDGSEASAAMVAAAFGTDPATLADASPIVALDEAGGAVADALIVTRGTERRRQLAADFAAALTTAGGTATLIVASGYSHADVNAAVGDAADTVVAAPVEAFLSGCLGS